MTPAAKVLIVLRSRSMWPNAPRKRALKAGHFGRIIGITGSDPASPGPLKIVPGRASTAVPNAGYVTSRQVFINEFKIVMGKRCGAREDYSSLRLQTWPQLPDCSSSAHGWGYSD